MKQEIQFKCAKEDLIGAEMAGLGESRAAKLSRHIRVLTPILGLIVLVEVLRHLPHLGLQNGILLPGLLAAVAIVYLRMVQVRRRQQALSQVEELLLRRGKGILGSYYIRPSEEGLHVAHNGYKLIAWNLVTNILANDQFCKIEIRGQDDILIPADSTGFVSFTLFVETAHAMLKAGPSCWHQNPAPKTEEGDIWDVAYAAPFNPNHGLSMVR